MLRATPLALVVTVTEPDYLAVDQSRGFQLVQQGVHIFRGQTGLGGSGENLLQCPEDSGVDRPKSEFRPHIIAGHNNFVKSRVHAKERVKLVALRPEQGRVVFEIFRIFFVKKHITQFFGKFP